MLQMNGNGGSTAESKKIEGSGATAPQPAAGDVRHATVIASQNDSQQMLRGHLRPL